MNSENLSKMKDYKNALLVHGEATRISKRYGIDNFSQTYKYVL